MIYKDADASLDDEQMPSPRTDDKCLNCKCKWQTHHGWACPSMGRAEQRFSHLPNHKTYMTQSMKDSITVYHKVSTATSKASNFGNIVGAPYQALTVSEKQGPDVSDWRLWQHKAEGECVCGIRRHMCDYHRK